MATGEDFKKRCQWLAEMAGWAAILLFVGIAFEALWQAFGERLIGRGGGDFRATIHAVGVELVSALPAIFLGFALWSARDVFARMGAGRIMDIANAKGLAACGNHVIEAAVMAFIVTPSALGWLAGERHLDVDFDWATVALFLLGIALTLFADVLRDAAAARAELDEIV
jgi:hypothetical protein